MRIVLGIVCVAFGSLGWVGQLVSGINFPLAQKLSLQEKDPDTDPLFRRAEKYAARWDTVVLWTLVAAGVLILLDHRWWPYVGLVAGGVYLDGAGREMVKYLALNGEGVRIGSRRELLIQVIFFILMFAVALWTLVYSLVAAVSR